MANPFAMTSSRAALARVWQRKRAHLLKSAFGVDRLSGKEFDARSAAFISELHIRCRGTFKPDGLLAFAKMKASGSYRIICVPTIADRLIQYAILDELRPCLSRWGLDNPISYGLAPTKARSVLGARASACKARSAAPWVYKTDISKFFDKLDRELLIKALEKIVTKKTLLPILKAFVSTEITDGIDPAWKTIVASAGIEKGRGVRQGMPLSPFFAGIYLKSLDRTLLRWRVSALRYVDDIIAFFESEQDCIRFHKKIKRELEKIGLQIGDVGAIGSKTIIYSPDQPASFLGMELIPNATGGYELSISQDRFEEIENSISEISSISVLLSRKITLTRLGSYFESVKYGYLNAFDGAHNWGKLKERLDALCKGAQETILIDLLGQEKVDQLTAAERRFIGLSI